MSHTQQPAGMSHEDEAYHEESITDLKSAIQGGLITVDDADLMYRGKTVLFGQTSALLESRIEPIIQRIPGEVTL